MNQATVPSVERDSAPGPAGGLVSAWVLLALTAALAAWLVSTPFLSLHALSAAADRHDDAALQRYADLPTIRASLAAQLAAAPADAAVPRHWWSGVQRWFAQQTDNAMLAAVDTPQGLVALASGYGRWSLARSGQDRAQQAIGIAPRRLSLPEGTRWRLVSLSQVRITVPDRIDPAQTIDLLLQRDGLRWRLVDIRLPATQNGGS
ncbi:DUF2939 domain-containing protein [Hydrocarboniphaga sp.]|uniref:DUF2939 domain-containing protein n=1 Tax=Hydrocarboniphaga sp. TaxID=2033016 RepID=UPI003D0971F8